MNLAELIPHDPGKSEGTDLPYWGIAIKAGFHGYVLISHGIWFSREGAEEHLDAKRHRYPKTACVYCFSGHMSGDIRKLYALADEARAA